MKYDQHVLLGSLQCPSTHVVLRVFMIVETTSNAGNRNSPTD